ncbi:unnamed protein product, partial [Ceratitis capitata]
KLGSFLEEPNSKQQFLRITTEHKMNTYEWRCAENYYYEVVKYLPSAFLSFEFRGYV